MCYIETKNLDGETNLKLKQADKNCIKLAANDKEVLKNFNSASIECEKENDSIYTFQGNMTVHDKELMIPLDFEHFILRGCTLRNTDWIYGVTIFTGHDTKIMLNSAVARPK